EHVHGAAHLHADRDGLAGGDCAAGGSHVVARARQRRRWRRGCLVGGGAVRGALAAALELRSKKPVLFRIPLTPRCRGSRSRRRAFAEGRVEAGRDASIAARAVRSTCTRAPFRMLLKSASHLLSRSTTRKRLRRRKPSTSESVVTPAVFRRNVALVLRGTQPFFANPAIASCAAAA